MEKMFQPVNKYPYVANATTSKNDSTVSSSFSTSDAVSGFSGHKIIDSSKKPENILTIRAIREEHRKVNPIIGNFFQVKFFSGKLFFQVNFF